MTYDTQPFCSMICPKITADFVGDENFCPVNSTLYKRSTRPLKLWGPLFSPPAHTSMEASLVDRVLFSHLEAPAGDRGLSGAERGCLLRPSGLTPDGVFCLDVHLTGGMQRAAHNGRDHLQSEALLALCRL